MTYLFVVPETNNSTSDFNRLVKRCHKITSYLNSNGVLVRDFRVLCQRDKVDNEYITTLKNLLGSCVKEMWYSSEASFYQLVLNPPADIIYVIPDNRSQYTENLLNFEKEKDDNIFLYKIHDLYHIEKEES